MSNEYRLPANFTFGTLSQAAANSDTTLVSSDFAGLSTGYSTSIYLPIVLLNQATKAYEVVWITGHSSATPGQVTVLRGRESTSAQTWPSGTQWICAPTTRDGLLGLPSLGSLPTDLHIGAEVVTGDNGLLVRKTNTAGIQPSAGMCLPSEVGKTAANGTVPATATILKRVGCVISATPSSGSVAVTFAAPFPNGVIGAVAASTNTTQFYGEIACNSLTVNGFSAHLRQLNDTAPGVASFYYEATGW